MERLLADASKIAGVEFNIDNYNDVIEAIHVMQESMGIAGTTMEEGASTISGSIAMTKAAWQNLLTGLADPNADLGKLFGDLIESGAAVLENAFPVILNVITRLFTQVPQVVGRLIMELPGKVRPLLESAFGEGMGGAMADGLQRALETISTIFNEIYSVIEPIVSAIVGFIQEHWPEIQAVISAVMDAVSAVISTVWPVIKAIVETVMTAIGAVVQAVWPVIVSIVEAASAAIRRAMEALQPLVQTVTGIFEGIKQAITHPIETAKGIISGIIETIKGFFSNFHIELPHIKLPHFGIEPAGWQIGDLLEGKIPHLAINWYAQGGIVDGPTLIGAGEAGPELILPQSGATMDAFADTVARRVGGGINVQNMTVVTDSPEDFMRQLTSFAARTRRQYA
jgi:phage-related protein